MIWIAPVLIEYEGSIPKHFWGTLTVPLPLCAVGSDVYQYLYTIVLAGMTGGSAALVRVQGRNLTDRPRLCKMD